MCYTFGKIGSVVFVNKKQKVIVITLLLVIIALLGARAVQIYAFSGPSSRTIMIYMDGNNLESDYGIATSDLESILPSQVDLNHINVLVYTGSTKKWKNDYISNEENAIFQLDNSGFKKIESYAKKSLSSADTFSSFLNYAYNNYKASRYDLIMWNHGAGALGGISDEFSGDLLFLNEMDKGLKNSPFVNEKLETVLFRTCLNATIEVASVYSKYAHYMIASEEITLGKTGHSVLDFLNNVNVSDNGIIYGNKFINSYQKQIDEIDWLGTTDSTYSIIDLDNFANLESSFNTFIDKINVNSSFNMISRVRKNLHQYAFETASDSDFDTIDLYGLVNELKSLAPMEADNLLKVIKKTIKYNWSTNEFSNGLSIYFPYNGSKDSKKLHSDVYSSLEFGKSYVKFLKKFNEIKENNSSNFSMKVFSNKFVSSNKKLELQLNDDQFKNYAGARYILFRKNYSEDGKVYKYYPLISSYNVDINDSGVLTANVDNNLVKVIDKKDGFVDYITVVDLKDSKEKKYQITAVLTGDANDDTVFRSSCVNIDLIFDKDNKPNVSKVQKCSKDMNVDSNVLDLKDWKIFSFLTNGYEILDKDGKYITDWPKNKVLTGWEVSIEDLEFESASLDLTGAAEYYGIFEVYDVYGNGSYSNLIKIN